MRTPGETARRWLAQAENELNITRSLSVRDRVMFNSFSAWASQRLAVSPGVLIEDFSLCQRFEDKGVPLFSHGFNFIRSIDQDINSYVSGNISCYIDQPLHETLVGVFDNNQVDVAIFVGVTASN